MLIIRLNLEILRNSAPKMFWHRLLVESLSWLRQQVSALVVSLWKPQCMAVVDTQLLSKSGRYRRLSINMIG